MVRSLLLILNLRLIEHLEGVFFKSSKSQTFFRDEAKNHFHTRDTYGVLPLPMDDRCGDA